jgi:hypothetical protein
MQHSYKRCDRSNSRRKDDLTMLDFLSSESISQMPRFGTLRAVATERLNGRFLRRI